MNSGDDLDLTQAHRTFAQETNARVWELLAQSTLTEAEQDELLYAAHASCYHWFKAGTGVHQQRGEYLIAKAYLALHNGAQALAHARRCWALTEAHQEEMQDFDLAFAHEILARAYAINGNRAEAMHHYQQAQTAGAMIEDSEDRRIFESDLAGGEWFGVV